MYSWNLSDKHCPTKKRPHPFGCTSHYASAISWDPCYGKNCGTPECKHSGHDFYFHKKPYHLFNGKCPHSDKTQCMECFVGSSGTSSVTAIGYGSGISSAARAAPTSRSTGGRMRGSRRTRGGGMGGGGMGGGRRRRRRRGRGRRRRRGISKGGYKSRGSTLYHGHYDGHHDGHYDDGYYDDPWYWDPDPILVDDTPDIEIIKDQPRGTKLATNELFMLGIVSLLMFKFLPKIIRK